MLDAVKSVASTSVGDDCGEGFTLQSDWAKAYAALDRLRSSSRAQAQSDASVSRVSGVK
jgi:hypothetical protein